MTLARVKTWTSEVLTATDLNAEFNNILNSLNNSKIYAVDSLTLATNDFLQYSGTAWANKTPVQTLASLMVAGQIPFPATQAASSDANTLDDYEEGTWTPADGSGASLVFTSVSATYVKIGQLVYITGALIYPSTASGATAAISGLPFASASIARQVIPLALSSGNAPVLVIRSAVSVISPASIADVAFTNANLTLTQIAFSGCYRAGA